MAWIFMIHFIYCWSAFTKADTSLPTIFIMEEEFQSEGELTYETSQVNTRIYDIWKAISQTPTKTISAILIPCGQEDVYTTVCGQARQKYFCRCKHTDNATYNQDVLNVLVNYDLANIIENMAVETDDPSISIIADSAPTGKSIHIHMGCSDLGSLDFTKLVNMPMVLLIVDCDTFYHPVKLWRYVLGGSTLLSTLINAFFVTSYSMEDILISDVPSNVDTITLLPVHACKLQPKQTDTAILEFHLCGISRPVTQWTRGTNVTVTGGFHLAVSTFNTPFNGFSGRELRVGVLKYVPFVNMTETPDGTSYSGYCIEILYLLAEALQFRVEIIDMNDEWDYIDDNGTWKGAIVDLMNGNIDILLSGLTISAARLEVVDFSFPFWEEKLGMIVGTVNYQNMYLVRPLHVYVWLCYGAMAFLTAALLVAVSRNPGYDTLLYHFFYLLGGLCNEGLHKLPQHSCGMCLVGGFWLCVVLITAAYNSNLMAFLSVTNEKLPFETLAGVVYDDDYVLYTYDGGMLKLWLQESQTAVEAAAWQKILADDSLILDQESVVKSIVHEGDKGVLFGDYTNMLTLGMDSGGCNWGMMQETFLPVGFGIAFQKGTPFRDAFDAILLKLHSTGNMIYLRRRFFGYLDETGCDAFVHTTSEAIGIGKTWPLFAITSVLLVLAAVILFAERWLHENHKTTKHG